MTHGNVSIRFDKGKFYYWHYNGDHYISGIRDDFGFLELLRVRNINELKEFFKEYYENSEWEINWANMTKRIVNPAIYYSAREAYPSDYSYVLDHFFNRVLIYRSTKLIFDGDFIKAEKWIKEYKEK